MLFIPRAYRRIDMYSNYNKTMTKVKLIRACFSLVAGPFALYRSIVGALDLLYMAYVFYSTKLHLISTQQWNQISHEDSHNGIYKIYTSMWYFELENKLQFTFTKFSAAG